MISALGDVLPKALALGGLAGLIWLDLKRVERNERRRRARMFAGNREPLPYRIVNPEGAAHTWPADWAHEERYDDRWVS